MYSYTQLVQMVLRLVRGGISPEGAIARVAEGYAVDPASLREWVAAHLDL